MRTENRAGLLRWLVFGGASAERVERALSRAAGGPRWLWHAHIVVGVVWMVTACGPTSVVELGGAPLALLTLVRAAWVWRALVLAISHPAFVALAVWTGWRAVSLAWSPDPGQGLDQLGALRFAWSLPLLAPLAPVVGVLGVALAVGFAAGNASQLSHALSGAGVAWLPSWDRLAGRNSGWWDPVVGGTLLAGALGLHVAAALRARGAVRGVALAAAAITGLAILATGTRGAWLAGGGVGAVAVAIALRRAVARGRGGRGIAIGAGLAAAVLATGLAAGLWRPVADRALEARRELSAVVQEGDFGSFTGARLLMMWWSVQAFTERPVLGTGEGGYRSWVGQNLEERGIDPADRHVGAHPHTTYLQPLSATGAVGGALFAWALAATAGAALRAWGHGRAYAAGAAGGLVGLFCAGLFDPVHVNAQTAAMWMVLLALAVLAGWTRAWDASGAALWQAVWRQQIVGQTLAGGEGAGQAQADQRARTPGLEPARRTRVGQVG